MLDGIGAFNDTAESANLMVSMYLPRNLLAICSALSVTLGILSKDTYEALGQGGPATVVVAPVIERQVASSQSFVANVNPHRRSVIGSAVDGRVSEFLVDAGEAVEAKQPLAKLRTKTIEIELAGAQAELELRRAELAELRNGSRPAEIELAEATMRSAEAAGEYAQAKLARAKHLFAASSGLSKDEFESAETEALTAIAKVAEIRSTLELVREGPRQEQIDQAAARVAMQEQVVGGLKDRLAKYTSLAPFKGYVTAELTEAGAWVRQGDPLAEVVEVDPVEVEVFVPESSIRFIRRGAPCSLSVDAVPGKAFEGTVEHIVPLADSRSRTFPVRVLVENPMVDSNHLLLPGMLARVTLPTGDAQMQILVSKDALRLGGEIPTLLKVVNGTAQIVPVRTGPSTGSWISVIPLVADALKVGDLVVTRGNERLRPGQPVKVSEQQPAPQ
ncbi:MAG: efflux RND transporter periplasmic adaptor subunit [Rubripirellula sp.]